MTAASSRAGESRPDCRLGRQQRILDRRVFEEAFAQETRFPGRYQVLWLRRGAESALRLGVIASRRTFPRAADRSRARRLMRESFRMNRWRLRGGADVVLVGRGTLRNTGRREVESDFLGLARKAGLLSPIEPGAGVTA